ncbi:helix-turn-helix transcriptional regulator [Hamadaea sp. NPDC051192]|uniref:helix-turn-helix domain-containing protein n=1 Tax=Hamadaea sp. NPDC051192 TaxID=3154940 RepID=UPI00342F0829
MVAHPSVDYQDSPSLVIPLEETWDITTHSHPQHQLVWAPDSVLAMEADGCRWVVQRNRALWIPGGTPHAVLIGRTRVMMSLYFEPDDCPIRWDGPTVIDATGLVGPLLRYLTELSDATGERRVRANAVLWDLVKPMAVTTLPTVLPTDPQARQVALAIRRDPVDARGLVEWGREVGASPRTLSRRFRAETGVTFESWRTYERLNAALPLLGDGLPVSRVARAVGYQTASAFITAFRRGTGITPAAYFGGNDAQEAVPVGDQPT